MMSAGRSIEFPPLLTGIAVAGDPFVAARQSVDTEVEPGAIFYGVDPARMQTAIVLAPEEPLAEAVRVGPAVVIDLGLALADLLITSGRAEAALAELLALQADPALSPRQRHQVL